MESVHMASRPRTPITAGTLMTVLLLTIVFNATRLSDSSAPLTPARFCRRLLRPGRGTAPDAGRFQQRYLSRGGLILSGRGCQQRLGRLDALPPVGRSHLLELPS